MSLHSPYSGLLSVTCPDETSLEAGIHPFILHLLLSSPVEKGETRRGCVNFCEIFWSEEQQNTQSFYVAPHNLCDTVRAGGRDHAFVVKHVPAP
jgi:hypothetical protein